MEFTAFPNLANIGILATLLEGKQGVEHLYNYIQLRRGIQANPRILLNRTQLVKLS